MRHLWWAMAGLVAAPIQAQTLVGSSPDFDRVEMYFVDASGPEEYIGTIIVRDNPYGVVFDPALSNLKPGMHGFHVHENASCQPNAKAPEYNEIPAGAAGAHYDPTGVDIHSGPWDVGHLGDLPMLYVNRQGAATYPVLAPRLEMQYLKGRSLILHALPDDYSDTPPDSGPRIACGILFSEALEEDIGID